MKFEFSAKAKIELESINISNVTKLNFCEFVLKIPKNVDENEYYNDSEMLNIYGAKMASLVFLNGIMANIHSSHQAGVFDSAEHFRWVISEMETLFVKIPTIKKMF